MTGELSACRLVQMPRTARRAPGGMIFHVLNRGNARDRIFDKDAVYAAFEKVLAETQAQVFLRILSYCLMPNHWHLVLWPLQDGDLGWQESTAKQLGLESTFRSHGRPRKASGNDSK